MSDNQSKEIPAHVEQYIELCKRIYESYEHADKRPWDEEVEGETTSD